MNTSTLIWGALKRHKARTIFTFLSVVVAFILFSLLAAVRYGMMGQLTVSVAERLDTNNKVSQGNPLPLSYYQKIVTIPGVAAVTYLTGFNGYYKDPKNAFQILAFSPTIFTVYAEAKLPLGQLRAWLTDRQGVIVGPDIAKRMGWKVGDTIPVQSKVPQKDGSTTWYFHLLGIYHADLPTAYQSFFIGHYQYFNEGVADAKSQNLVFQYIERVDDPRNTTRISNAIDTLFANSSPQTLTQSEVQETVSFIRQFGNITAMVIYIGIAVFFSLLLIVGNTLAQSVRERTSEFAMFRALGFKRGWIILLVFQESLLLIVSGGILGLILGYLVTRLLYPGVGNLLQTFGMTWNAAGVGIALSLLFGIVAALVPMQRVTRLQVAEALRRA
ncbi:MAG: FtsX-like permease family protein [Gammaproteobacteria bacterium]